jgi:hypothetical protein
MVGLSGDTRHRNLVAERLLASADSVRKGRYWQLAMAFFRAQSMNMACMLFL